MDLLKSFGEDRCLKGGKHDEEIIELSLGLSCNGKFGVDGNNHNNNSNNTNNNNNNNNNIINNINIINNDNGLVRCCSIGGSSSSFSSEIDETTSLTLDVPLTRTCSLPVETEDEWKKRKEIQALRRSEAKRKRVEKVKNGRVVLLPPLPRPSVGSPGSGGSSGVSDLESQLFEGRNQDTTELKSTASQQHISHQISTSSPCRSNSIPSHTTSQTNRNLSKNETIKMMFADMPCVSTKGEGVNCKKIEGFLYRYRKGEEVRIVCVCHGSFLTPAEFVKHGGGGDVEHPLRHIVVVPPTL